MKRVISTVLLATLLLTMIVTLTSCGGPDGKYGHEYLNLEFDGDKVTVNVKVFGTFSSTGKYKLGDDNEIIITYDDDKNSANLPTNLVYNEDDDTIECKLGIFGTITLDKID